MRTSLALRNAILELYLAAIGAGAKAIGYTAPRPATTEDPPTGSTKLYEMPLADPPLLAPAADGSIPFAAIADVTAINSGVLSHVRIVTSAGDVVMDIPAAELGNPGAVATGNTVKSTGLALQLPAGA